MQKEIPVNFLFRMKTMEISFHATRQTDECMCREGGGAVVASGSCLKMYGQGAPELQGLKVKIQGKEGFGPTTQLKRNPKNKSLHRFLFGSVI